jgi:hypothetical protein
MMRALLFLITVLVFSNTGTHAESLNLKETGAGKKLYVAKCAKCHKFYEPKSYTEVEWQRWMDLMSRKSKLKSDQQDLLTRYLNEYRANGAK